MKLVLSWLREFCPTDLSAEEMAELLTSRGAKVGEIGRPWDRLSGVMVARVLEVRDHPNSDTLCLARVTTGVAEREVVVGVRNMKPGDLVPLAGPGATLPALPEPLTAREIRGVVSDGMLCSPYELAITQEHTRILILPEGLEPGKDFKQATGLGGAVLDVEVTPNRPDLMSVVGVAREVAAATGVPVVPPDTSVQEEEEKAADVATVEILDLERCPRYLARVVRGVSHVPAPILAQARLTASGMRPISAVVDATNYAMLELGHPMHPFDLDRLDGPGIVVRRAEEREKLTTLDDVERTLTADDLLICDRTRPVAVAGIMGGASAEVSDRTNDALLESAYFERRGIMRTARRIGLSSEASMRFERGADPEAVPRGADRACQLMAEWCGARVLAGAVDVGEAPGRRRVSMRASRARMLLGYEVTSADATQALERLGLPLTADADTVTVEVPGYRVDIEREVDLIEEVVRIEGYDRVGSTLPPVRQPGGLPPTYAFLGRIRRTLVRAGLREVRLMSFASGADLGLTGDAGAVRIANPISAEEGFLRTSLLPGLLRALAWNQARQVGTAALFEVGTVFRADAAVEERRKVALVLAGPASVSWNEGPRELDVFDATGAVEALLESLSIAVWGHVYPLSEPFHPGRSAGIWLGRDRQEAGVVGELHPRVAEQLNLAGRVAVAELDVEALISNAPAEVSYRDIPRLPPVRRDLAFVLPDDAPAWLVRRTLVDAGGDLLASCRLFDVFAGPPLPEGKKSLAFSVDFRAPDRTLTDEEADAAVAAIVERLAHDFGAEFRAG